MLVEADEDCCLVIPNLNKSELDTFMQFILTKQIQVDAKTMKTLEKVSQFFNFQIIDKSDIVMIKSDGIGDLECIDYGLIFANQKEEFINRISKQSDIAKIISEKMESKQQQYSHRNA